MTLTTRYPYAEQAIGHEVERRLIRRLARMTHGWVGWFWALEENVPGHPHVHILLGGTASLKGKQLQRAWKAGFTRVHTLRHPDAAIRYAVKSIGRLPDRYDISRRLIPKATDD